jgi:hypothetical protein
MDIKNITLNETSTLKNHQLPPKTLYCKMCKSNFISYLRMNVVEYMKLLMNAGTKYRAGKIEMLIKQLYQNKNKNINMYMIWMKFYL